MNTDQKPQTIETFLPTIQIIARKYAGLESADELAQVAILDLIEYAQRRPDFMSQKPAYILSRARCAMLDYLKSDRRRRAHLVAPESENGFSLDWIPGPGLNPETAVIIAEEIEQAAERIQALSDRPREVIVMVLQGYRNGEIAQELGISPQAVSNYKRTALQALNAV